MRRAAQAILRPGLRCKRGGVGLADLMRRDAQGDLFARPDPRRTRGMEVLDRINAKYGRGTVGLGLAGWNVGGARPDEARARGDAARWRPILKHLSPSYTTRWSDLLRVG